MEKIMEFLTGTATQPTWEWLLVLSMLAAFVATTIYAGFTITKLENKISRMAAEHGVIIYDIKKDYNRDWKSWQEVNQNIVDDNEKLENQVESLKGQLKKKTDELREDALEYASRSGGHPDAVMAAAKKYYRFLIGKE